ncbi:UNVERIFIED_CONTAM: 50S ribosomal protein 5 alpha, chloroplastic [Sesamum angustifolium]|uniref:50S ribosomal protein 5 alpha, chloroplastic n=1 Tax=Sesamum angustifolium TaxID=2727405 RepID=A0AAW2PW44_9LAMI
MALLFTSPLSSLSSPPSYAPGLAAPTFFRLCNKSIALHPKSFVGGRLQAPFVLNNRGAFIVKASLDVDGTDSTIPESPTPPSDSKEESVPVENLPLESKLQLKLDQKLRMKMAKKIRLRRKRLVRKRHLRKKGRWPPSKLKKNKNV